MPLGDHSQMHLVILLVSRNLRRFVVAILEGGPLRYYNLAFHSKESLAVGLLDVRGNYGAPKRLHPLGNRVTRWNRPKCSPTHSLSTLMHHLCRGKSSPKMWATTVIFEKLHNKNSYPMGEDSPNLVALLGSVISRQLAIIRELVWSSSFVALCPFHRKPAPCTKYPGGIRSHGPLHSSILRRQTQSN
jgi:hypothetical protein